MDQPAYETEWHQSMHQVLEVLAMNKKTPFIPDYRDYVQAMELLSAFREIMPSVTSRGVTCCDCRGYPTQGGSVYRRGSIMTQLNSSSERPPRQLLLDIHQLIGWLEKQL